MAKAKPKTPTPTPPPPAPKKKTAAPQGPADPALDHFAQGLAALQAKDWKKAAGHLEKAIETADRLDLRDKARQFLNVALQKGGSEEEKAARSPEPDPYLQAVYERNRGDLQAALAIAQKGGRDQKDERFAYLAASIHAVEDRLEDAAQALAKAVELNPKNRIHAFHDADFAELRKNRDQRHLFGLT
jgi:tetratricopeptide (TPR) repeat protein